MSQEDKLTIEALQARVKHLEAEEHESQLHLERACRKADAALAKLAALEGQKPSAWLSPRGAVYKTRFEAVQNCEQMAEPLYAAAGAQREPAAAAAVRSDIDIHLSHCFQPPYDTSCKYGDDDCPATPKVAQPEPGCAQQKIGPRPAICERCGTGTCTYVENPPNPPVQQRAQPEPVSLTDEQIQLLWDDACKDTPEKPGWCRHIRFARAVLAAAKGGAL